MKNIRKKYIGSISTRMEWIKPNQIQILLNYIGLNHDYNQISN